MKFVIALAVTTATPAGAQEDDRLVPGFTISNAQILARPTEGQFIARARANVRPRELEAGIARLCGAPARAARISSDRDRRPSDITYLVRCRP